MTAKIYFGQSRTGTRNRGRTVVTTPPPHVRRRLITAVAALGVASVALATFGVAADATAPPPAVTCANDTLFRVQPNGQVAKRQHPHAAGSWTTFSTGVFLPGTPILDLCGANRLYAVGTDDHVWTISDTAGPLASWTPLGTRTFPAAAPVAGMWTPDSGATLDMLETDGHAYAWRGSGPWQRLGTATFPANTPLTASPAGQVYGVGSDNHVWAVGWAASPTTSWAPLGNGTFPTDTALGASSDGTVFGVGFDHRVWRFSSTPGSSWTPVGTGTFPYLTPISIAPGTNALFGVGYGQGAWTVAGSAGSTATWTPVGNGIFPSRTELVPSPGGMGWLYAVGTDNGVWTALQTSTPRASWHPVP